MEIWLLVNGLSCYGWVSLCVPALLIFVSSILFTSAFQAHLKNQRPQNRDRWVQRPWPSKAFVATPGQLQTVKRHRFIFPASYTFPVSSHSDISLLKWLKSKQVSKHSTASCAEIVCSFWWRPFIYYMLCCMLYYLCSLLSHLDWILRGSYFLM